MSLHFNYIHLYAMNGFNYIHLGQRMKRACDKWDRLCMRDFGEYEVISRVNFDDFFETQNQSDRSWNRRSVEFHTIHIARCPARISKNPMFRLSHNNLYRLLYTVWVTLGENLNRCFIDCLTQNSPNFSSSDLHPTIIQHQNSLSQRSINRKNSKQILGSFHFRFLLWWQENN